MVYDTQITIVNGIYKPTYKWGAPHCTKPSANSVFFHGFYGIECLPNKDMLEATVYMDPPNENQPFATGRS